MRMQDPDGESLYLRLSTKPIDQRPFTEFVQRVGEDAAHADVVRGAYRLREPGSSTDRVILATCGAMVPETLAAAEVLETEEGVSATVLVPHRPDRLYHDWRAARTRPLEDGRPPGESHLARLVTGQEQGVPVVTVLDGASHALAWIRKTSLEP